MDRRRLPFDAKGGQITGRDHGREARRAGLGAISVWDLLDADTSRD